MFKDERFTKERRKAMTAEQLRKQPWVPAVFRPLERNMLDLDPPSHTRLRALVQKAFTPRLIEQMRSRTESLAEELLDAVAEKGAMDLVRDYALPLPMTLITEILGVPARDRDKFHQWSKVIVSISQARASRSNRQAPKRSVDNSNGSGGTTSLYVTGVHVHRALCA